MNALVIFLLVILFFHTSEVAIVALNNYEELSWSSTITSNFTHTKDSISKTCNVIEMFGAALLITWPYCLAMSAGVCESLLRGWLLGASPFYEPMLLWGLVMVFIGEAVRKTAMVRVDAHPVRDAVLIGKQHCPQQHYRVARS